ncbi:hypothetical protein UFOVP7_14 [uncultured Caudovirales phage]|uniref:Uncharacterized protein n=1 Tax=uncultured Caudovirales phage TaxID=2100421 RepID=A0A6J5KIM5_9CAUD|nr:hypothetical protein UFOVP7_14 [uncultured Caudovirales phage]
MYNQAEKIISKFGNARRLAELIGVHPVNVYRWTYPRARGGTDGLIPTSSLAKILLAARTDGILLTLDDFVPERVRTKEPDLAQALPQEPTEPSHV